MLLIDTHMHSSVSFDGSNTRREMSEAARTAGLNVICFTDHYDIINEKNELVPHYDWMPARQQHGELPPMPDLKVLYGLELGNVPADFDGGNEALEEQGLDCVIGSIHNGSWALNGQDFYYVDYRNRPELAQKHLEDYFASEAAMVNWGNYDTLGHLPYPLRYMRERDGVAFRLRDFREQYWALLKQNAAMGKAVEVNTNRARDDLSDYRDLLLDWKAAGGQLVTVGADAHQTSDVGKGIVRAYDLLKSCGFDYVTYFEQRKPVLVKL